MNQKITVRNYFGGCPKCGRSDGLYNVYKEHWFVCHTHKVRWTIGSNILSSWRDETREDQRERWAVVADYEDIKGDPLPEGVWSRDHVARKKELEEHQCRTWAVDREKDARHRARAENRDRAVVAIVEVLEGLALEVEGSGPLEVMVDDVKITCAKEGVTLDDALPF
jgi:hypothetical protein